MNKLESFFKKADKLFSASAWTLRIIILILWVVWVVPVWKPVLAMNRAEKLATINGPQRCLGEKEIQAQKEYYYLRESLAKNAKAMGRAYGPKEYFTDLKRYDEKGRYSECAVLDFSGAMDFQRYLIKNMQSGYYTEADMDRYRTPFEKWASIEDHKRGGPDPFREMNGKETLWWLVWFAVSIYWKGLILALFLYLARMAEGGNRWEDNEGIFSIFLDDKMKFLVALLDWPHYLLRYPYNIKKRIIVEAELRRLSKLGEPFRRMSKAEKRFIRRIAEADDKAFQDWRIAFRRDHEKDFQRSFAKALLLTLAILLFTPTTTSCTSRRGAVFWGSARAGPTISVCTDQSGPQTGFADVACLPEPVELVRTKTVIQMVRVVSDKVPEELTRSIDHVPVSSGCAIAA